MNGNIPILGGAQSNVSYIIKPGANYVFHMVDDGKVRCRVDDMHQHIIGDKNNMLIIPIVLRVSFIDGSNKILPNRGGIVWDKVTAWVELDSPEEVAQIS